MALRLPRSSPTVASAGNDLAGALSDFAAAIGRWLALQPAAQEVPVYADRARRASAETLGHAGEWAGSTASRAKARTAEAASATKTTVTNLLLVAVLVWWVDRLLTRRAER